MKVQKLKLEDFKEKLSKEKLKLVTGGCLRCYRCPWQVGCYC